MVSLSLFLALLASSAFTIVTTGFGVDHPFWCRKDGIIAGGHQRAGLCLHGKRDEFTSGDTKPLSNNERESSTAMKSLEEPSLSNDVENDDDRARGLRRVLESLTGAIGNPGDDVAESIPVGATVVVAGSSLPSLGLYEWQSYELLEVYDQGVEEATGMPVKIPQTDLIIGETPPYGYQRYARLYSERYHSETGPVVVAPNDEVRLVSVRDEVLDSLRMALPIFGFWTALAISFANGYNEQYGGNFLDALFRT